MLGARGRLWVGSLGMVRVGRGMWSGWVVGSRLAGWELEVPVPLLLVPLLLVPLLLVPLLLVPLLLRFVLALPAFAGAQQRARS
jgi:hypothetical protein